MRGTIQPTQSRENTNSRKHEPHSPLPMNSDKSVLSFGQTSPEFPGRGAGGEGNSSPAFFHTTDFTVKKRLVFTRD